MDRVYTPSALSSFFSKVNHKSCAFSDHSSVSLELCSNGKTERGPSSWVFDKSLLEDQRFTATIRDFWHSWKSRESSFKSLAAWWDRGKERIKQLSKAHSYQKSKSRNLILKSLYKRLRNAENKGKTPLIVRFKSDIRKIETESARDHFLNARLDWLEGADKCSKTFFSLISKRKAETTVHQIEDSKGIIQTESKEILKVFENFYEDLFKQPYINENDQEELLGGLGLDGLSPEEKIFSDSEMTLEDFRVALMKMQNGKSPGSDGLTAEFYKGFWDILGPDLFRVIMSSYEVCQLSESQRSATIKCLPKTGNILLVKYWRPVSLLNVDYKILAKALSLKLLTLLPSVISEEQTCCIKGRKIAFNLSTLRDCVEIANREDLDAFFISLDQTKAFDRVSWNFLFKVLHKMNFGSNFIHWIKILYTDISSRVNINGFNSNDFLLERGVRQGCPLSPLLYVLYSEVLTILVKNDQDIQGFNVRGIEIKLSQYADDFTALLIGLKSLFSLFKTLNRFERVSGALVNPEKTKALWLGQNKGRTDSPLGLDWTDRHIKILGLPFGNSPTLQTELWKDRISSIKQNLNFWRISGLSLKGKVTVIKHLIMPKIIYAATIYPPSESQVKSIRSVFEDFLWNGGRPKIPTDILQLPIAQGGLALPDVSLVVRSLCLVWVREIFCSSSVQWRLCAFYFLNLYRNLNLSAVVFKIVLSTMFINLAGMPFWYHHLLTSWLLFTQNCRPTDVDPANFRDEPLLLNPIFKVKGTSKPLPLWSIFKSDFMVLGELYFDWIPNPMTLEQFNEYHGRQVPKRLFHVLKSAVPPHWHKSIVSNENDDREPASILKVFQSTKAGKKSTCISKFSCRTFYRELTFDLFSKVVEKSKSRKTPLYTFWSNTLGEINWSKIFQTLFSLHFDTKTVETVYRFLHFSTTTRVRLFNMKLSDHRLCTRCYAARSTRNCPTSFSRV